MFEALRSRAVIEMKREIKARLEIIDKVTSELKLSQEDQCKVQEWKLKLEEALHQVNNVLATLISELDANLD